MTVKETIAALAEFPLEAEVYMQEYQTFEEADKVELRELKQATWGVVEVGRTATDGVLFDAVVIRRKKKDYES